MAIFFTSKIPLSSMCLGTVKLSQVDHCLQASCLNGNLPLGGHKVLRPLVQWHHRVTLYLKTLRLPQTSQARRRLRGN